MVTNEEIKKAFLSGTLYTKSVDPRTKEVFHSVISDVMKHRTPQRIVRITVSTGESVGCTEDHSVYTLKEGEIFEVEAGSLHKGDLIVVVRDQECFGVPIAEIEECERREFTFDLCVPGPENFVLSNGILAHNSYSIGGISLDIDKSSKYEGLKNNAESQFDKATEAKARTVKITRGLQQPRFGRGVRSAFGPHVGRGVLSPRNFW